MNIKNKMCKQHNPRVIDKCMRGLIFNLGFYLNNNIITKACCCGHGKYPMTIIIENKNNLRRIEMCSGLIIKREKRFYLKDKRGYYYIPEVLNSGRN